MKHKASLIKGNQDIILILNETSLISQIVAAALFFYA